MKENHHFLQIEKAIHFLIEEAHRNPSLDETAAHLGLSPFHFQRLFQAWAGVSPKKFQQYLSYRRAKALLQTKSTSLFDVSFDAGLSGTARLHDLFVNITAMTPAEFRSGGKGLYIHYELAQTPFGLVGLAATDRGLCRASFVSQNEEFLQLISNEFPNATVISSPLKEKEVFLRSFSLPNQTKKATSLPKLDLHLKGTPFQLKVWELLLSVPFGSLTSYGKIAEQIGDKRAARAIGAAVGDNPIAYFIPCHRVIQSTGIFGEYHWGKTRKAAMIAREASILNSAE